MAKRCIFCGKEFGLFGGCLIQCGNSDLSACSSCYDQLSPLSPKERAIKALATGRAPNPQELQAFLERDEAWLEEQRSRLERARQSIRTDKTCLRCGGPMEKYSTKLLHLCDEGLLGPIDGLFSSWTKVEIIRCAHCGKAEFYIPQPLDLPEIKEEPTSRPQTVDQQKPSSRPNTGRHGGKPPWEK